MGDVAMTVPIIKNVLNQNPEMQITVVSNRFLEPLFEGLERCHFYPAHLRQQHKGPVGIFRLFQELNRFAQFDAVVDLHSVLRSHLLSAFFKLRGLRVAALNKGRAEKKALTRQKKKVFVPLASMHERYARVFQKIGLSIQLDASLPIHARRAIPKALEAVFASGKKVIGVAPFAQYAEKMYPIEKMKSVVAQLTAANCTVLLFGGGEMEAAILNQWEEDIFSAFNVSGKYSFKEELSIISNLDQMLSMDSANMHFASLFNVPVLSIWGATHPYAGFNGWGQGYENTVQVSLACRPCSVFGNKPCYRGDHACMYQIGEEMIVQKVMKNTSV